MPLGIVDGGHSEPEWGGEGVWDGVGQPRGGYGSLSEVESINLGITSIEGENIRMKTVALDLQQCLEILL